MHWHEWVSWSLQGSLRGNYAQLLQWECEAGAHREMCGKMFPLCSLPPLWACSQVSWQRGGGTESALGEQGQQFSWKEEQNSMEESKNKVGPTGTSVSI